MRNKLISFPKTNRNVKSTFISALVKLSECSGCYPKCLTLRELSRESEAICRGGFSVLYKGKIKDRAVAVKAPLVCAADKEKILRVCDYYLEVCFLMRTSIEVLS